jgi:hypothetical protein
MCKSSGDLSTHPIHNLIQERYFFALTLVERGVSLNTDLPSSPGPFSQNWEKGSERLEVPLPMLGEGFRVRANG